MSTAATPSPPYYAVIFSTIHAAPDDGEYAATADRMEALASRQPGFLGIESARNEAGFGITVSYWRDEASIASWKAHLEHAQAREQGRVKWYARYELRVAKVERAYGFERN